MCIPARNGFLPSNRDLTLSRLCCIVLSSVLGLVDMRSKLFPNLCATGVVTASATCFWPGLAQLGTNPIVVATLVRFPQFSRSSDGD